MRSHETVTKKDHRPSTPAPLRQPSPSALSALRIASLAWSCAVLVVIGTVGVSFFGHAGAGSSPGPGPDLDPLDPGPPAETVKTADDPKIQGPATEVPQEILAMLNQRHRALEQREEAVRTAEGRLESLKQEIEQIVARHEQLVKAAQTARQQSKQKQSEAQQAGAKTIMQQVASMYETMPSEEAATRLEKMPMETALSVLRSIKSKTAGAILSQMKPEKAAKLTERLLATSPPVAVKTSR